MEIIATNPTDDMLVVVNMHVGCIFRRRRDIATVEDTTVPWQMHDRLRGHGRELPT